MSIDLAQAKAIFLQVAEQSSVAARQALLAKACGDDAELRQHVEVLLAAHEQAGSFLEQGALAREATIDQTPLERPGTQVGPYKLMEQLAEQGVAVLFVSSELEEILGMSDRVLVMHEGRITGELLRDQLSEEAVMRLATGSTQAA